MVPPEQSQTRQKVFPMSPIRAASLKRSLAILILPLALAACTDPARLGGFGGGAGTVTPGTGTDALGDPSNPTSVAYFQQSVGDRVFFAVDQSTLSPEAEATLTAQANWLMDNPSYVALIEGHADEQGTREYNLALGARRAASAEEFLVTRGVAPNRVSTVTYGKERPVEICSDERCYAANRRAVTVLTSGLGS